jgi:hypothetical protein
MCMPLAKSFGIRIGDHRNEPWLAATVRTAVDPHGGQGPAESCIASRHSPTTSFVPSGVNEDFGSGRLLACVVGDPQVDESPEMGDELLLLVGRVGRLHRLPQQPVEVV